MCSTELQDDFRCKQGALVIAIKNSGILRHAAKVYTYKLYKLFKIEFINSLAMTWEETSNDGHVLVFQIKEENYERVRTVRFNSGTNEVDCSCKLFEWLGILCRHTL
jgi:SWIM zinc finger